MEQTLPRPGTGSPLGLGRGITTLVNVPAFKELNNKHFEENQAETTKKSVSVYFSLLRKNGLW